MITQQKETMSPYFAVFNGHVNNAFERAKTAFIKRWGQDLWDENLKPHENGIMGIFNNPPNKYILWYVETIAVFVNEET